MLRRTMLAGLASFTLLGACSSSDRAGSKEIAAAAARRDVVDVLAREDAFSKLLQLIKAAEYEERLRDDGPLTLFAPNDSALGEVRQGRMALLLRPENRDWLRALIDHHIVAGRVPRDQVVASKSLRTIDGAQVAIRRQGQSVLFGTGNLVRTNIGADNGIIHAIDKVQFPQGMF